MNDRILVRRIQQESLVLGDFTLRSGKKSSYYFDKYSFEADPAILYELGSKIAEEATDQSTCIAGIELGSISLAVAASLVALQIDHLTLPVIIIRQNKKEHGTAKLFEGPLKKGDSVLLVEDVVTTGENVLKSAQIIMNAGATVDKIVAIIDREEGGTKTIRQEGFIYRPLFTASDFVG
jgi:orotate phosphoribosyltransferase